MQIDALWVCSTELLPLCVQCHSWNLCVVLLKYTVAALAQIWGPLEVSALLSFTVTELKKMSEVLFEVQPSPGCKNINLSAGACWWAENNQPQSFVDKMKQIKKALQSTWYWPSLPEPWVLYYTEHICEADFLFFSYFWAKPSSGFISNREFLPCGILNDVFDNRFQSSSLPGLSTEMHLCFLFWKKGKSQIEPDKNLAKLHPSWG